VPGPPRPGPPARDARRAARRPATCRGRAVLGAGDAHGSHPAVGRHGAPARALPAHGGARVRAPRGRGPGGVGVVRRAARRPRGRGLAARFVEDARGSRRRGGARAPARRTRARRAGKRRRSGRRRG
jgi:hypothetical protein